MKRTIIALLSILLLIPLVTAHAIEKGPISKSTEEYIIEFSVEPKFPVTGKLIHLDFIILLNPKDSKDLENSKNFQNKDKPSNLLSNLNAGLELHKQGKTITLDLKEEQKGHYSTEYNFNEAGNYEIHIVIGNKELKTEFDLEIDSFGLSGLLRVGVIIVLLLILIMLMYKDCRRKKNG